MFEKHRSTRAPKKLTRSPIDPSTVVTIEYLKKRAPTFDKLMSLRDEGWKSGAGDDYFVATQLDQPTPPIRRAMFSNEFGVPTSQVLDTDREKKKFTDFRPFFFTRFDLIFCSGQLQWDPELGDYYYWRHWSAEDVRLRSAQIVMALQRIRNGGTMVMLLKQMHTPPCIDLMRDMEKIAVLETWKSQNTWTMKSSFHLVAKEVNTAAPEMAELIEKHKRIWREATFEQKVPEWSKEEVEQMLSEYGEQLVELGTPTWEIQAEALENAEFIARSESKI